MQHTSTTPFGRRPVDSGVLASQALAEAPAPFPAIDKWRLFDALREARATFGVTDRDLTVLNALLSFLPARELTDEGAQIVFPSNASLCDRAHGMAESTLRRHLAALVQAGLIARNDSPNGKRYATRDFDGGMMRAFGFSLRPLLTRAPEILERAETAIRAARDLRMQREGVVLLLRDAGKLIEYAEGQGRLAPLSALALSLVDVRRALRRKADAQTLLQLETRLRSVLADVQVLLQDVTEAVVMEESHGNAAHFGRLQQNSNTDLQESEPCPEKGKGGDEAPGNLPLALVVKACPDLQTYAQREIRSWREMVDAADYVRGMMGVSPDAWAEAIRVMGRANAAVTLAAILQRMGAIHSPGGYLRSLTAKAAAEGFSPGPMIMALLSPANAKAA